MFTRKEIKQNLLGSFEIFLFMKQGVERFSSTKKSALKSFIIPAITLPLLVLIWILKSNNLTSWDDYPAGIYSLIWTLESDNTPIMLYMTIHTTRIVLSILLSLTAIFLISKGLEKQKYFYKYITACNWFSIIPILLTTPIFLQPAFNITLFENIESYAIFISLAGYLFLGYIATQVFKIPWELGASTAILIMCIDETLLEAATLLKDFLA